MWYAIAMKEFANVVVYATCFCVGVTAPLLAAMKYDENTVLRISRESASEAEVVETVFPTRDVVIAERVISPDGAGNSAPALQGAIDDVAKKGGGVVFLKAGSYSFRAPVTVRRGVTVRGDYSSESPAKGTVLRIFGGRGDEEGQSAFSLENGSGLEGLVFFYPEQQAASPVAYPWTVRTALGGPAGNNQTILDCSFVNAWQAIRVGPETNECHTFRRLRICALKTGFMIDMTTDIGRITDVLVSPEVWSKSGFRDAPECKSLSAWLKGSGATGAVYRRSDWEFVRGLSVRGYATGIRFEKAKVPTNAVIAGSDVTDCSTALQLDDLNWVGLACYDSVFSGTKSTLGCAPGFRSTVLFNACTLKGAPVVVSKRGTLSFSHCDISAALDASSGGMIKRIASDKVTPTIERIRAEFPAWPRPKGSRVLFASDFGALREGEDNTSAIQKALDEAGKSKDGATVYVAAGYYHCAGTLKVPSGVELRGSSNVPHHTQNGGTVLLATAGKGKENGEPFITLAHGSGVRGIGVWYPEQPISEPVAYPWTIRSLVPGCWLADVNLGNSWQGVDFAAYPSDGHRISYVSGGFFKTGVLVGNARSRGWVEDLQFNPHYMLRLSPRLTVNWGPKKPAINGEHPVYLFCRRELRGIVLRDCADEVVVGTFLYAARDGISFEGGMHASVLITGVDTACRGARLMLAKDGRVRVALGQIVPLGADVEAAIVGDAQNRGETAFMATQTWPKNPILVNDGTGYVVLDQVNACGCSLPDADPAVSTRLIHQSR